MAIFFALLASLGWGTSEFLGGYLGKNNSSVALSFWRFLVLLPVHILGVLIFGGVFHVGDIAWGALAGIAVAWTFPTYFWALARGQMGIVAPLTGVVGAAVPVAVGYVTGESPTGSQIAGIALAFVAIALVSTSAVSESPVEPNKTSPVNDVKWGVLCGLGAGIFYTALDQSHDDSGLWPLVWMVITIVVLLSIAALIMGQSLKIRRKDGPLNTIGALCDGFADWAFIVATRDGLVAIAAVFGSLYPAVIVILARIVLKERFGRIQLVGLVVALASLVFISFAS